MTALRTAVVFNSSTGSDTAASGVGPSTAVSGSGAAHTNGSASTTITLTNTPNLSGVQAGDLLWLNTTAGRQYSVIASVDDGADTVTVDDSFNIAGASAVDYAIGGKRATLDHADSRTLGADFKADWIIEIETDQTLNTSAFTFSATATVTIRGNSESTHRTITQTANAACFIQSGVAFDLRIENLKLANSNATKTAARGVTNTSNNGQRFWIKNCIFGDATNKLLCGFGQAFNASCIVWALDCVFQHTTDSGMISSTSAVNSFYVSGCHFTTCGDAGIEHAGSGELMVDNTIITGATADGIRCSGTFTSTRGLEVSNCTIRANGGDGIDLASATLPPACRIYNNNLTENGGYGLTCPSSSDKNMQLCDFNNYGTGGTANTSGARNNVTAGANDLAVDPQYTNTGSGDYSVGTNVKAKGFPLGGSRHIGADQSSTYSYVDIGAAQRQEAAAGGGAVVASLAGGIHQ